MAHTLDDLAYEHPKTKCFTWSFSQIGNMARISVTLAQIVLFSKQHMIKPKVWTKLKVIIKILDMM